LRESGQEPNLPFFTPKLLGRSAEKDNTLAIIFGENLLADAGNIGQKKQPIAQTKVKQIVNSFKQNTFCIDVWKKNHVSLDFR
jgi:hypothetical protein